jgi:tetratricopeptide (TPR) repeat protein
VYEGKNLLDRAIQDFTQAILLNPQDLRTLSSRANLYCQIGDFRRAILDYSQVFQIMPADTSAISRRGYAYLNVGDYDRAIADFDECLYRDPYDNYSIEYRGIAYLNKGDYQHAAMDLDLAVQSNFQNTYFLHNRAVMHFVQGQFDPTAPNLIGRNIGLYADAAWLYIGKMRAGQNADGLLANAEKVNINSWPGPIILMLAGKMDRTALLQAASDRYIFKERDQRCDAYFFLAEQELLTNSTREAVEDFEAAIGTCLRSRVTYAAAKSELQRLGH